MFLKNQALAFADMGWSVFPLAENSKVPYAGTTGFHEATTDKAQIEKWWTDRPLSNIGISTGMASKVVVLDVDVKNGSPGKESLRRVNGLYPTLIASTPSGGWHYYYLYEKPMASKIGFMPGLDFKADGGYVVGPGSVIDDKAYEWIDPEEHLTMLPDPIRALVEESAKEHNWKSLSEGSPILQNKRNMTLASVGGLFRWSGLGKEEIHAALQAINAHRCKPPLPEKDVTRIGDSVCRYSPSQFRKSLDEINQDEETKLIHYASFHSRATQQEKEIVAYTFDDMPQFSTLTGGIAQRELVVITGHKANGKTLFCLSLGRKLLQQKVKIAWLSYEVRTLDIVSRYMADRSDYDLFVPMQMKPGDFEWVKAKAIEAREIYGCDVLFIDHLHYIVDMKTSMNMSLNIGAVLRSLRTDIAMGLNMAVILVCHQAKENKMLDAEPSLDSARDSSFISQEPDLGISIYRKPDSTWDKKNAATRTFREAQSTVKIDKARRTGYMDERISFVKRGDWLEEF